MPNVALGGFKPVEYEGQSPRARRYPVASGYGTAIFPGDVVTLVAAGTVEIASTGGADLILGIVSYVSYVRDGVRIDAKHVPASTAYSPTARGSANETHVWVYDDPRTNFVCNVASHTATDTEAEVWAALGANCDITAGAGSTYYGRSGHVLDGNVAASALRFRIIEILREPSNDLSSANWKAKVAINEMFHVFGSNAGS